MIVDIFFNISWEYSNFIANFAPEICLKLN
jgi:hypothetical protein